MLQKILLDTNMLIYLEDDNIVEEDVAELTRRLYDSSEYKIVIHPKSMIEALKIKDKRKRDVFLSKIRIYKKREDPPLATEEFQKMAGFKNENDRIDNELLYAIKQHCASFLISNDIKLKKKSVKLGIGEKVFGIQEALKYFKEEIKPKFDIPVFIKEEFLYKIEVQDEFFDSLRKDYYEFNNWFQKKQESEAKAYVTRNEQNKITSFLMLKKEDKDEKYDDFENPIEPDNRIKVSTFKVADTGKRIGETFIKIIISKAVEEGVNEIYVTIFPKQNFLIDLFKEYGFKETTYKNTTNGQGQNEKEVVLVRNLKTKEFYPFVKADKQNIFILPVKPVYHKLLFPEAEKEMQLEFNDYSTLNTSANAIKKAFITNARIKKIRPGDILLFYASHDKKAITTLGVVDATFTDFKTNEEIYQLVRKRTAYNEEELKTTTRKESLVIMFKHYLTFDKPIDLDYLKSKEIVKGNIQRPISIESKKMKDILDYSKKDYDKIEIN